MTQIFVLVEHLRGQVCDISYTMLTAARAAALAMGAETVALLLGHNINAMAGDLDADRVVGIDDPALAEFNPGIYAQVLHKVLDERQPSLVMMGHTTIGMDLASGLAIQLGWPLTSQVRRLTDTDGGVGYISQICGGKLLAEGKLSQPGLITMVPGGYKAEVKKSTPAFEKMEMPSLDPSPIKLVDYVEPEAGDVDISQVGILVAVGRGIGREDEIEMAEELAEALGGAVCASRPVVDQGWLPTSRLVGKSGRNVKPRLYLALGISGAPEHVEAIVDPEAIIAINSDPNAPIFNLARYGCVADLFDVIPSLLESLEKSKVA